MNESIINAEHRHVPTPDSNSGREKRFLASLKTTQDTMHRASCQENRLAQAAGPGPLKACPQRVFSMEGRGAPKIVAWQTRCAGRTKKHIIPTILNLQFQQRCLK